MQRLADGDEDLPYSKAFTERLFIGSVGCDARFTHAVAKAFSFKIRAKRNELLPFSSELSVFQLGDSEVPFPRQLLPSLLTGFLCL